LSVDANSSWMSPSAFFDEKTTSSDGSRSMHSTRETWTGPVL
jgi:hypothetical protein